MKKNVSEKIIEIQNKSHQLVYNSLKLSLNYFYEFIETKFGIKTAELFLSSINSLEDLNYHSIEENWMNFCFDHFLIFDNDLDKTYDKTGIYFIQDIDDNIIYIGKSNNLGNRALQSFLCKMPYGSHTICLIELSNSEISSLFEAIAIDYFSPICNQKFEQFENIHYRTYAKIVRGLHEWLDKNKKFKISVEVKN